MEIRRIEKSNQDFAIKLAFSVFMQFEAPDYSDEGVKSFKDTVIYNHDYLNSLVIYGAFHSTTLMGMIATRNGGNHIALFFVDGKHHRQGIGRMLFQKVLELSTADEITVNSSPYAVPVYSRLGFIEAAKEQTSGGIRFTPMVYKKEWP